MKKINSGLLILLCFPVVFFSVRFYTVAKNRQLYSKISNWKAYAYTEKLNLVPAVMYIEDTSSFNNFFNDSGVVLNVPQPEMHFLPADRPVYISRFFGNSFVEVYHFDTCCWGSKSGFTHLKYLHFNHVPTLRYEEWIKEMKDEERNLKEKNPKYRNEKNDEYGGLCWFCD